VTDTEGAALTRTFISLADVSRVLGVSRATVYRLVAAGELPIVRIGDRTLVRPPDLEGFINALVRPASRSPKPQGRIP
jgi:excisionase family DNA binding protein